MKNRMIKFLAKNDEESSAFQVWAFSQGARWGGASPYDMIHQGRALFINERGFIAWDDEDEYHEDDKYAPIYLVNGEFVEDANNYKKFLNTKIYSEDKEVLKVYAQQAINVGVRWNTGSTDSSWIDRSVITCIFINNYGQMTYGNASKTHFNLQPQDQIYFKTSYEFTRVRETVIVNGKKYYRDKFDELLKQLEEVNDVDVN
ncbi:hypothetical protein [Ralstonia phage RSP15]|uniref:hypothetical protein n=1 Tax=Ralstonia phage RSP15 TaxID=1785960 RepID=UPI00074D3BEE|nr:hypothetical protein BH754_gp163 [Ralstonia phage RSP15]BAU40143.1 hypothetical protein [Ralstonia phage RSP15]